MPDYSYTRCLVLVDRLEHIIAFQHRIKKLKRFAPCENVYANLVDREKELFLNPSVEMNTVLSKAGGKYYAELGASFD